MNSEVILTKVSLRRPCHIATLREWLRENVGSHEKWRCGVFIMTQHPTDYHVLFNTDYISEEFITMFMLKWG